jgi:hypothetical protein
VAPNSKIKDVMIDSVVHVVEPDLTFEKPMEEVAEDH